MGEEEAEELQNTVKRKLSALAVLHALDFFLFYSYNDLFSQICSMSRPRPRQYMENITKRLFYSDQVGLKAVCNGWCSMYTVHPLMQLSLLMAFTDGSWNYFKLDLQRYVHDEHLRVLFHYDDLSSQQSQWLF
ncbi:hypothetical protein AQUCO_09300042v1 [Aquilegia coerulea]|uniref:Uncharacterized protein n=1 Tax=Aquilegia coerulea TaxID=218851 RepID=A0A2G5C0U0_AQUCA|nr:hypothetical protein AQUCO_16800002v1 [Aquilegia coerulea]PIA26461.1 hypothetical protein AQUCO_09300042v1 [Aquilegia coerulea]